MKKLITLCCCTFLCILSINAQYFDGGITVGMTASEVSGDNASGPNKVGVSAGVFTSLKINENSKVQLEMMYIQKGSKVNPNERNNFLKYRFHLEYIEVPILYKFYIPLFKNVEYLKDLEYEIGLSYARLLRYNELNPSGGHPKIGVDVEDFHYNESNIIIGFLYPLSEKLKFNFRLSNSLTPIRPHKGGAKVWYNWGQYHTLWNLSLTYSF
ncbi:MAG: porin family protein [Bacteroidales bacterium]|nr:porin family protein [Bacteroidales bacterium]